MIRKSHGFTLVEMMVATAIVAVLAALAVDAYQKSARRAKTRFAQIYLSTAYSSELTFLAEHQSFTHCLRQIKGLPGDPLPVAPDPNPRPYFIGFSNGVDMTCGPSGTQTCFAFRFNPVPLMCACGAFAAGGSNDCGADSTLLPSVLPTVATYTWTVTQSTFTIGAVGEIGGPQPDIWTMDQNKLLLNIQPGQ